MKKENGHEINHDHKGGQQDSNLQQSEPQSDILPLNYVHHIVIVVRLELTTNSLEGCCSIH